MQIQPPSWHSVLRAGGKAAFRQRSGVTYHDLRHRCWHGRLRSGRAIRHCGKPDAETIPILAMTANAFDDDRQKSLSAGMNDYLPKPLDIPKLTEASPKFRTTPTDSGGLVG